MKLPRPEILLYVLIGVGTVIALSQGIPRAVILSVAVGLSLGVSYFDYRRSKEQESLLLRREQPPAPPRVPWRDPTALIVPVMLIVLAATLHYTGARPRVIVFLGILGLALYAYSFAQRVERFRDITSPGRERIVSVEDWGLLGVSLAFCLGAVVIWHNDPRAAVQTVAIFGGCALMFIAFIRRKLRSSRFKPTVVRITGCVDIPVTQGRHIAIAVGCLVVGMAIAFVDNRDPLFIRLLGGIIALTGVAVLLALMTGVYRRQFIRFEPSGIVVGHATYRYRLPWDSIRAVMPFEYAQNPFVGLGVTDVELLEVEPANRRSRFARMIRSNQKWFGTDILFAPLNYGMEAPLLAAALVRYVECPEFRSELGAINAPPEGPLLPAR